MRVSWRDIPLLHRNINQSVNAMWDLEWKLSSLPHGESYKVCERGTRRNLMVWVSRMPLDADQQRAFRWHVTRLGSYVMSPVVVHGIDNAGTAYVALQTEATTALDSDRPSIETIRRRFVSCVAQVAVFHEKSVNLGNISPGSFVLTEQREVEFVGILGGFAVQEIKGVPPEARVCMLPPGMPGTVSASRADVFSLAVLGLRLFGAQFPASGINSDEVDRYTERIDASAPRWLSEVLKPIVKSPSGGAIESAGDLLSALSEIERRVTSYGTSRKTATSAGPSRSTEQRISVYEIARRTRRRIHQRRGALWKRLIREGLMQAIVFLVLVGVAIKAELLPFARLQAFVASFIHTTVSMPSSALNSGAKAVTPRPSQARSFGQLAARFNENSDYTNRSELWRGMVQLLRDTGYKNVAAVTEGVAGGGLAAVREPERLAGLIDPGLSVSERIERLRAYETFAPESAARVAAAFASDQPESRESYRDILMANVQKALPSAAADRLAERSTRALVAALDLKNEMQAQDLAAAPELTPADLWWLLDFHGQKRSAKLVPVLDILISRGICEGARCSFLTLLRKAEISPETPYHALIASAQHGPTIRDVELFSKWMAPESEQALYATLLTSTDRSLHVATLDALRGKPQLDELVVGLIRIIGEHEGDVLPEYALLVGALGLKDTVPPEILTRALTGLRNKPLTKQIATKIFQAGDTQVITMTLPLYGSLVHPDLLLPLLEHNDATVRQLVLPLLNDLPLASSRQVLERWYSQERDPQVREVYERVILSGRE